MSAGMSIRMSTRVSTRMSARMPTDRLGQGNGLCRLLVGFEVRERDLHRLVVALGQAAEPLYLETYISASAVVRPGLMSSINAGVWRRDQNRPDSPSNVS